MRTGPYRIATPPTKRGHRCPRCGDGGAGLTRHYLGQIEIEECSDCLGQWFDRAVFSSVVMDPSAQKALIERARLASFQSGDDVGLLCPVCGETMVGKCFGASSTRIDICRRHGVWLDHGELRALLEILRRADAELAVGRDEPVEEPPELGERDPLALAQLNRLELARDRVAEDEMKYLPIILFIGYVALELLQALSGW